MYDILFIRRVDVLVPGDVGGRGRRERGTNQVIIIILHKIQYTEDRTNPKHIKVMHMQQHMHNLSCHVRELKVHLCQEASSGYNTHSMMYIHAGNLADTLCQISSSHLKVSDFSTPKAMLPP